MKIVFILNIYADFISNLYRENNNLYRKSYEDQVDIILKSYYNISNYRLCKQAGFDFEFIFYNCIYSQNQWAMENSISSNGYADKSLLVNQIENIKPDILYFSHLGEFEWLLKLLNFTPTFIVEEKHDNSISRYSNLIYMDDLSLTDNSNPQHEVPIRYSPLCFNNLSLPKRIKRFDFIFKENGMVEKEKLNSLNLLAEHVLDLNDDISIGYVFDTSDISNFPLGITMNLLEEDDDVNNYDIEIQFYAVKGGAFVFNQYQTGFLGRYPIRKTKKLIFKDDIDMLQKFKSMFDLQQSQPDYLFNNYLARLEADLSLEKMFVKNSSLTNALRKCLEGAMKENELELSCQIRDYAIFNKLKSPTLYNEIGALCYRMKDFKRAALFLEQSFQEGQDIDSGVNLYYTYLALNDRNKARRLRNIMQSLFPTDGEIAELQ